MARRGPQGNYDGSVESQEMMSKARMLRIYFLQQWFNLSDPAVEEALYDSAVMRQFVGIDLGYEPVPDETRGVNPALAGRTPTGRTDPGAGNTCSPMTEGSAPVTIS
jgi:hypothetical protein